MNFNIQEYFKEHDFLRVYDAEKFGVSRAVLSLWAKQGKIMRVAQGVYAPVDSIPDDLYLIAQRSDKLVFSHETALVLHGLHNRIPDIPSITLPQSCSVPHSLEGKVKAYRIKAEWHGLGLSEVKTFMGHIVPCYNRERTICDIIKSRSRLGPETYTNAIKSYAASRNKNIGLLSSYATKMGIIDKVYKIFEVLI